MRKLKIYFYSFCAMALCGWSGKVAHDIYGTVGLLQLAGVQLPVRTKKIEVEKIIEVKRPRLKFAEALEKRMEIAKVPAFIVRGVLKRESSEMPRTMGRVKYEDSYRAFGQTKATQPDEVRAWASSHCPFQIMAWHAAKAGLDWSDLYDPEVCVHFGMKILEECWERAKSYSNREKVARLGRCYNGGSVTATDSRAVEYGNALQRWAEMSAYDDAIG